MTKLQKSIIKQALLDVDKMECDFIDTYPQPSKTIENISWCETSKVVYEYKGNFCRKRVPLKRRITICILAALLAASMVFSVGAIRKPIIEFFIEIFDDFIHISADDKIKENIESYYVPTYLPVGYTQKNENIQESFVYLTWSNGEENIFMTQRLGNYTDSYLDKEDVEFRTENLSGSIIHYVLKNGDFMCIWANDEYTFMIKCPESVGWDNVVKIISSMQEVTP